MSALDVIGALIGLLYVVSEYRADRWFWPLSLLMSAFYAVINFQAGYYANLGICCYNFAMSVYGMLVWRGVLHSRGQGERPIGSCPARLWPLLIGIVAALTAVFYWLLGAMGESSLPVVDGLSSAISIVGMWMLSQKYWQQWFAWLVVEPLMIGLYLASGLYASAVMYAVYEVFVVLGLIRWKRESIS
ncbi:MAG: nicotinamide mononucleotide transporter [Bacteroidales bacterium]|nr:nicotinamide mononucleotide transporter [Bacteroidales bacterium]